MPLIFTNKLPITIIPKYGSIPTKFANFIIIEKMYVRTKLLGYAEKYH